MSRTPESGPSQTDSSVCFSIHAPSDPSVMPRVLAVLTRQGIIPTVWHSVLCGADREEIRIDLQITGLAAEPADQLARCLRQLVSVRSVLTSESGRARAVA